MSISLSCNLLSPPEAESMTAEAAAERDAYYAAAPPPEHLPAPSVGEVLARLDLGPGPAGPLDPAAAPPDPIGDWLAVLAARPVDATTYLAIAQLDPATLAGTAVRHYLALTDKVLAAVTAAQHAAVLAVADTARAEVAEALAASPEAAAGTRWQDADTERTVREDLERTLGCTSNDADARLTLATVLRDRIPTTGALLASGMVSARKASQLAHLLEATTAEVAAQVDGELADQLQDARPASLRRRVARRLLVLDSELADRQDQEVVRGRTVRTWSNSDGSATLSLTGPAEAIQHAWCATTGVALAQLREPGATVRPQADNPSVVERDGSARMDRARFDAAVDLLCSGYDAPWFPASQGKRRTLVQLVTTVATLNGEDDNLAELVGHGPVTAETARRIAADAGMFQELAVHPTMGFLMDAGTVRHDPPAELREFVLARRPTCAMPGCTRSVMQGADLDHTIEHRPDGTGGPTAAWAMHGVCRFHHRGRTAGIWRLVEQRVDGSMVWVDLAGRRYVEPPHDLRPDPGT